MGRAEPRTPEPLRPSAYRAFMLLGGANLTPWMTFLAMADYFDRTYRTNLMEFAFPAIATCTLVATSAAALAYGHRFSFFVRIVVPTAAMAALMLALPLLDAAMRLGAISASLAFRCTLGVVFLNTLFSATAQNSLYGLGGMLGDAATQALQAGTGVIGVVAVAARALTKLGMPPAASMLSFCAGGAALVLGSLGAYYAALADPALGAAVDAHDAERRRRRAERRAERAGGLAAPMLPRRAGGGVHTWRAVVGRVWVEALSAFVVFFVCLACFPGVSTSFTSRSLGRWFPLLIVALYNVGDLAGKALPGAVRLIRTRAALLCCVGCHVCFVPLFLGALHAQRAAPASAPLSDAVPMALALSLGVSSGYLGCTALMLASEREGDAELKERGGSLASFALMLGLSSGSVAALALSSLLGGTRR